MQFPADYSPAWWPSEDIVVDMVQVQLDRCVPGGVACTWINSASAEEAIAAGKVIVRVHAQPGHVEDRRIRVVPIELEVLAARRDVAHRSLDFLSDELCRIYRDGGQVGAAHVRSFEVDETPQQVVFIDPDERMVHASFVLTTSKRTPQ